MNARTPSRPLALAPLRTALALLVWLACASGAAAQVLPIPGLPGGLGSTGPTEQAPAAPEGRQPAVPQTAPESGRPADGGAAPADPTRALIDILRDDAAREALIRELEAAAQDGAGEGAPGSQSAPAAGGAAPGGGAGAAAADEEEETVASQAVAITREIGLAVYEQLEDLWLRAQRIPTTHELAMRAFEDGVLEQALREIVRIALHVYVAYFAIRLLGRPVRRGISRAGASGSWTKRLFLRLGASLVDLVTIPLAAFVGLFSLIAIGVLRAGEEGVALSQNQALFVNAFAAVEFARTALRFVLSPGSPGLRLMRLGDRPVRSFWWMLQPVVYLLGYGQLFVVPVVSDGVSIFVGRALSSLIGATALLLLIVYIFAVRRPVARWLHDPEAEHALAAQRTWLAARWHWPVQLYLLGLLVSVLTRPGNVLLPVIWTTTQVLSAVVVGGMLISALTVSSSRRLRLPDLIGERLPLLEERLNQLLPAFLRILRVVVVLVIAGTVLHVLGVETIGGILSSDVVDRLSSGVISVLLVLVVLSIIWLGMTSWVDYRLNPFVGSVPTPREITLLTLMKNAVTVALIVIGFIMSLAQLGMNVGPLIASAGVIGLAISFGAQRMVEDIFSGIFIQAEGAMNVGDVVDVGGTVGVVEKLTVRSVTLRDLSGVVHVIPFSSAAKISNYMRDYAYHLADIGVAYRENVEEVKQAMYDAFEELRRDAEVGPNVLDELEWFGLNSFGASELMMRARIKTKPGEQWGVGRAYNAIVKRIFDERGIEIPFPHQTVYFGEDKAGQAPPLHLQVDRGAAPEAAGGEAAPAPHAGDGREGAPETTVKGTDMPDSGDS